MIYESQSRAYMNFIIDEAYNQEVMAKYIEEALLWTSGDISNKALLSLNEDLKTTVKDKFSKLWEKLKEIVRKVVGTISNFASSNQGFLEKNKEIITGKVVKYVDSLDMYPYTDGIKKMGATQIKEFDYEKVKNIDPDNFSQSVVHQYFGINEIESTMEDFQDKLVDLFRGAPQEKTYSAKELNLSDMYDFCYNYKTSIVNMLDKEQKIIDNSYNKIISALSKIKLNPSNESYLFDEEVPFSLFFEQYMIVNEEDGKPDDTNQHQDAEKSSDNTNNKPQQKASSYLKDKAIDNNKTNQPKNGELEKDVDNSADNFNKIEEQARIWFNAASSILEAKTKVCKEIYDTYFNIMKKHVASYVGQAKDDKDGNTPTKNTTDYNNNLTDDAKKALDNQKNIQDVQIRYKDNNNNQTNADDYVIQITSTDNNGNNIVQYQDVGSVYKADSKRDYKPKSIKVYKDGKTGLWKIGRQYDDGNGGTTKVQFRYITPDGAVDNSNDYKDNNKVG